MTVSLDCGGKAHSIRAALDRAAADLTRGGPVSDEAAALLTRPVIPARLYTMMGTLGWYVEAFKRGSWRRLHARPFQPAD